MSTSRTKLMALALMGAIAGAGGAMERAIVSQGVQVTSTVKARKTTDGAGRYIGAFGYPSGPGWSNRHVKRMAAKRRNQARNKKAHRG